MSACPHHLLRSRFNAGLPSCFPRHSLRLGRQDCRKTKTSTARNIANYAQNSSTTPLGDTRLAENSWTPCAASRPPGVKSKVQHEDVSNPEAFSDGYAWDNSMYSGSSDSQSTVSSTNEKHEARAEEDTPSFRQRDDQAPFFKTYSLLESGATSLVRYNDLVFHNGEVKQRRKVVSRESVEWEGRIRSNCLLLDGQELLKWKLCCSELYKANFYKRNIKSDILPHLDLRDDDLDLLEKISTDCQGSFREAWEELGKIEKADHWKRLSLWLLHNSPELAWEFLLVTCQSAHKPVFLMVANSVIFLDAFYSDKLKRREIPGHTYRSVIETCLDPTLWPVVFLPQKGVRLYIQRADRHKVYQAYNIVHERGSDIKAETWLCFMHRFTELGDVDKALEALAQVQQLKRRDFTLDSVAVMRHCCKLLLLDSVRDDSKGRNFRILPKLLEMGVRPDRDMMNIVLANAFKTGDPQLGYDMLTYMKNQGIEPDSYTYLTLLNDAVVRGDRERVDLLTQEIRPVEEFQKNPWIASKLLHAHFTFTAKHIDADVDPNTIFYSMLDMYNQLYDLTPLKELTIIPPQYAPLIRGDNSPPSVVALYIIIATYLRCQNNVSNAQRVYTKFKSLVAQGHKTIAPLQVTDHVYNEFLVAFRDDPRGLRPAVRLVEDMLQASNDLLDSGRDSLVIVPAKPTVRTWTLLLATFIYSRQPLAAEKVKDMMAKHQVEYNVITWNVIISGYANAQNIPEVAKTIKAMEKQGFAIDEWTMKSLRYLRDPERLWVALEELDKGPEPRIDLPEPETASPLVLDENEAMENERQLDQGLQRLSRRT